MVLGRIIFFILLLTLTSCIEQIHVEPAQETTWPSPLRGINVPAVARIPMNTENPGAFLSAEDFALFSEWNVNVLRVWVSSSEEEDGTAIPGDYAKSIEGLGIALDLAQEYDIYIVPVLGDLTGTGVIPIDPVRLWSEVAQKYGSHPQLIGYDILNEPTLEQCEDVEEIVSTIRLYDQETYLVIEPCGYEKLPEINDDKIVLSPHYYGPWDYTHQGIYSEGVVEYPEDDYFSEDFLQVVRDAEEVYDTPIFIGEFSAVRWADRSGDWVNSTIAVFEREGWDWTYFSYGEWNGWNPTCDAQDPTGTTFNCGKDTERLRVLRDAWSKN